MNKRKSPIDADRIRRLTQFFEASNEGLFFHDQGTILDINPGVTGILGYSVLQIVGTRLLDYVAPEFRSDISQRMLGSDEGPYEVMVTHLDGRVLPFEVRAKSLVSGSETIRVVALRDISDRKQTEVKLKNAEERNREVVRNVPGVVYQLIVRPDKTIEISYISEGIEEISGVSPKDAMANPALAFASVLEEDLPAVQADIVSSAERMEESSITFRMKDKAGVIRWFHGSSRPRNLEDGSVLKNGILLDITKQKIAEQELEKSQQNFTALAENSKDGFLVNLDGKHVFANSSLARMLGYDSANDLIGTEMVDIIHPGKIDEVLEIHRKRISGEDSRNQYETLFVMKDGSPLPVELNATMTEWDGKPAGLVTVRDISERRAMEDELKAHKEDLEKLVARRSAALHESEARLSYLLSSSPTVIYTCEPNGDYPATYISENVTEIFGITPDRFLNDPKFWASNIHPDDAASVFENLGQLFEHDYFAHEYRFKLGDGRYIWVHDELKLLCDQQGNPQEIIGAWADITARKQAEIELAESKKQVDTILNSLIEAVWAVSLPDYLPLYCSESFSQIYGRDTSEWMNDINIWQQAIHSEDKSVIAKVFAELESEGASINQYRVVRPDDSVVWISSRMKVISGEQGEAPILIGIVQDISDRKNFEIGLIEAKQEAESANNAKSEFLSRMSHELRTPMNAILGFSQLLQMDTGELTNEQQDSVRHIREGGEHLLHLINEVLDIAKVDAGKMELSIEPVSYQEALESALMLVQPLALRKGVTIEFDSDQRVINLQADQQRLVQTLVNLLSNAIKYNREDGEVFINCRLSEGSAADNEQPMVRIEITDTGIGIRQKDFAKIFEPFQRVTVRGAPIEGTGIGLAISRKMIDLMGGQIGFDSDFGKGTTFWFELPQANHGETRNPVQSSKDNKITRANFNKTVLYVEDNTANQKLITQLLDKFTNCRLLCAASAETGIEIAREQLPDIILMDIGLPGIDGFEALKMLQQDKKTAQIPVVAVSAHAMPDFQEKGLKAGFSSYLTKPIDMNALLATIENIRNQ